jgi:ankyrin repeat protein
VLGLVFVGLGLLTFVALVGSNAVAEFGGETIPEAPEAPMTASSPAPQAPSWALAGAMLLCAAGILLMALRPVSFTVALPPDATAGPDGKVTWGVGPTAWLPGGKWPDTSEAYRDRVARFHKVAADGQLSRVLEMLQMGASADDKDEKGRTALMEAAKQGHSSVVIVLLMAGAQANERDADGTTALMEASKGGHLTVVKALTGIPVNPLALAALKGQLASLRPSLKAKDGTIKLSGLDLKLPIGALGNTQEIDARDKDGRTAFMMALLGGHHLIAAHLYRPAGLTVASPTVADAKGDTALHLVAANASPAVWSQHIYFLGGPLYLHAGETDYPIGDLNSADARGRLPWMVAAEKGHLLPVRKMLGASQHLLPKLLEHKDASGKTGLDLAREANRKEVVAYISTVETPTAVMAKPPVLADALAKAAKAGDAAEVEKLIKAGTPVAGVDAQGRTALLLAVEANAPAAVTALVQHGVTADPDSVLRADREGKTPLRLAASKGSKETLSAVLIGVAGAFGRGRVNWYAALIEKGKDGKSALELARARDKEIAAVVDAFVKEQLDVRSGAGILGVEDAADRGDAEAVKGLLALGASLKSAPAKNALMYAAEKGHIAVVEALIDHFKTAKERLDFLNTTTDLTAQRTKDGFTPTLRTALDLAREKGQQEVVSLIERARVRK